MSTSKVTSELKYSYPPTKILYEEFKMNNDERKVTEAKSIIFIYYQYISDKPQTYLIFISPYRDHWGFDLWQVNHTCVCL